MPASNRARSESPYKRSVLLLWWIAECLRVDCTADLLCRRCSRRGLSLPLRWEVTLTGVIKMDDRAAPAAILPVVATVDGYIKWRITARNWTFSTIAIPSHKVRIFWKRRVQIAGDAGNLCHGKRGTLLGRRGSSLVNNPRGISVGHPPADLPAGSMPLYFSGRRDISRISSFAHARPFRPASAPVVCYPSNTPCP